MAIGSETVSTLMRSSEVFRSGINRPSSRPVAMARPIHTGRNRSSVESLAVTEPVSVAVTGFAPVRGGEHVGEAGQDVGGEGVVHPPAPSAGGHDPGVTQHA